MEHTAVHAIFPEWKIWEQYTTDTLGAAQRLDSLRSSHPIQVPIVRAEEVEQVFDAISYCKGSAVVRMAEGVLGKDKFKEGLRLYMQRHAYGNTKTSDLWAAWTDVSSIDVAQLMASWTQQMGYPYLKVVDEKWTDSEVTVTLEQNWFLSDGSTTAEDADKLWSIPLLFATSQSTSAEAVIMKDKVQTFTVPLAGASDYLKINAGQQALVRVAHSTEMATRLQSALRAKDLGPVDRAGLLLDAYALAKAGYGSLEVVVQLLKALRNEDHPTVWSAISGVISGLQLLLEAAAVTEESSKALAEYTAFCGEMVKRVLSIVGWDAKEGESHSTKLLRSTVVALLDIFCSGDDEIMAEARRRYTEHWSDSTHTILPNEYKSTVYKMILKKGGNQEYEELLKSFYATNDNSEKKFVLLSLGATQDPALKIRTLDWCVKSGEVKLQDFFYCIGSVATSAEGSRVAWEYFKSNFSYMKEKLAKASASLMDATIGSSISRFCTLEQAEEVETFFKANPLKTSERRISQLLETMRSNGSMLKRLQESQLVQSSFWTLGDHDTFKPV